jgi:hypothetical protein
MAGARGQTKRDREDRGAPRAHAGATTWPEAYPHTSGGGNRRASWRLPPDPGPAPRPVGWMSTGPGGASAGGVPTRGTRPSRPRVERRRIGEQILLTGPADPRNGPAATRRGQPERSGRHSGVAHGRIPSVAATRGSVYRPQPFVSKGGSHRDRPGGSLWARGGVHLRSRAFPTGSGCAWHGRGRACFPHLWIPLWTQVGGDRSLRPRCLARTRGRPTTRRTRATPGARRDDQEQVCRDRRRSISERCGARASRA